MTIDKVLVELTGDRAPMPWTCIVDVGGPEEIISSVAGRGMRIRLTAAGDTVALSLDDARRLFDLATDSPLICSGSFETDDVMVLRRLAETIGVDPAKATPSEFVRDFPHPFEPFRVDIERNELRDHRAPHGIRWETDDEVYARLGQHPDHCVAGDYNRRCRRQEGDPIHQAGTAT